MTGPANAHAQQIDDGREFMDAGRQMEEVNMEAYVALDLASEPSRSVWIVQGGNCPMRFFDSEAEAIAFLEEFKRTHPTPDGGKAR